MMMYDSTKSDAVLGEQIKQYLISKGVETPISFDKEQLSVADKIHIIENNMVEIMETLGLDLNDDSLSETPLRVAKMWVKELMWGLDYSKFPKCTAIENKMKYDEMIVEKNITSMSLCEHHFVTIDGKVAIGYFPKDKVIGLSKMNRVVEFFSRRPQVQERLTEQVYHALCYILGTEDVAVVVDGVHYCVKSRGIMDYNSSTTTSRLGGLFRQPEVRTEFFSAVGRC